MSNPDLHNAQTPGPLVSRRVSHHSIELSWDDLNTEPRTGLPEEWTSFSVEEMNPKAHIYESIYIGYSTSHTIEGLEPNTAYMFRVKVMRPSREPFFSPALSVTTAREPPTGKNLHRAVNMNDEEEMKKILAMGKVNVNVPDKLGFTPLMVAAQKGFYRLVRILLEHGASVNMTNSSGKNSLMLACFAGHLDIVQCLRNAGASWTSVDAGGCVPLHWATDGGHMSVLSYMIDNGCEVDVKDNISHWTPLMRVSALDGSTSVASLLISAGADVNARDKDGKTPLMIAVLNNHEELVQLLLDSGADINVKNEFGTGAAEMAKAFGRQNIISLFEQKIH